MNWQTREGNETRTWSATVDLQWEILLGLSYQGLFSLLFCFGGHGTICGERSFYISSFRGYEYGSVSQ
ncbi:MAG: hypothetical protein ACLU4N_24780 [Butyricimonas faecihominis]